MSDNLLGKAVDQAGGVLEKAYNDLTHPTAKSLGNTVSLLPHTVGIWLQAMKSQGSNVGRDQMECIFSQLLTQIEKTLDIRTNRNPTANDEMVLCMLKEMQNLPPDQRILENIVGLTATIAGAQLQANEDTQEKISDAMMSIMAGFLEKTAEDVE